MDIGCIVVLNQNNKGMHAYLIEMSGDTEHTHTHTRAHSWDASSWGKGDSAAAAILNQTRMNLAIRP